MSAIASVNIQPRRAAGMGQPAGRAFLGSALTERSASALIASFCEAVAAEGVTRHFCALHGRDGNVRLLSSDYPFDPAAVVELGRLRFETVGVHNERVSVTLAGMQAVPDRARQARLHGYAMVYASCLPALLAAGEPQPAGAALSADESETLQRLLLGHSEGDIALSSGVSVRAVEMRISSACAKLGSAGRNDAIVAAAQRGFLNNPR